MVDDDVPVDDAEGGELTALHKNLVDKSDGRTGGLGDNHLRAARDVRALARWRSCSVAQCQVSLRNTLSRLLSLTSLESLADPEVKKAVVSNDRDHQAPYIVATQLGAGVMSDLRATWVMVAAARGSQIGMLTLISMLISRAGQYGAGDRESIQCLQAAESWTHHWARLGEKVAISSTLAETFAWGEPTPPKAVRPPAKNGFRPKRIEEGYGDVVDDNVDPPETQQRNEVTVCAGIGDPETRDGRDIVKAHGRILRPLTLAEPNVSLDLIEDTLNGEMPWMESATSAALAFMRLRQRAGLPFTKVGPLLLDGPPGAGKNHWVNLFARLAGIPLVSVPVSNSIDNKAVAATARGWSGVCPSIGVRIMARSGIANAAVVLDELEKANENGHYGSVASAVLPMLEPETARTFHDDALFAEVDLTHLNWFATTNDVSRLNPALRSRFKVVEVEGPAPDDFEIVLRGLRRSIAAEIGIAESDLPNLDKRVIRALEDGFSRSCDLRRLRRALWSTYAMSPISERALLH